MSLQRSFYNIFQTEENPSSNFRLIEKMNNRNISHRPKWVLSKTKYSQKLNNLMATIQIHNSTTILI